ncbi:tRNA (guanosine(18)-2'-O)-methyltransferase [Actinomadura rubteroloni]|uniref:tRNA (Guanosine(18)-2'-O)-methyltransferase n=1 Tax=Actinomadura rubteroloni TaxID=1926885 RepID=A0A2P4UC64_9ACTN|nr:TrmH family RNA methyltransferase [Actinomadura rubteroloni]POM22634.1 tRNA (guanosine(18)-2'-O)-methyltransferase [Actinomadura rubteroloni]
MTSPQAGAHPGRRQLRPTDVKRLNRGWRRRTEARLGLLAESVTQPFNIGSLLRSAAVFGVEHLWLAGNATSPDHRNVAKVALGTERLVPWTHAGTPAEAAAGIRAAGLRLVAIELTADAVPLHDAPLDGDVCLAVGGEDHGVSPALLAAADAVAYIPQTGRVGSLNVAVAAAIALAEARRREWAAGPPPA